MKKSVLCLIFVFVLLISIANAKDVAYVAKNNGNQNFIDILNSLSLSFDIINNPGTTDFSNYKMILIGNDIFNNQNDIPVDKFSSLIMNSFHTDDWGLSRNNPNSVASSQPLSIKNIDANKYITNGLNQFLQVYSSCCSGNGLALPLYSLSRADPISRYIVSSNVNDLDSVIAVNLPGTRLLNNKISLGRITFFGITETNFWTNDARELFKRSLLFTLGGNDADKDSYVNSLVGGNDCNDNDASIHPNAAEIPYDGIDQDCDGRDLKDADKDGYDAISAGGNDCNDNDASIHPNAAEIPDNINQNCMNDAPVLINNIPNLIFNEDTIKNNAYNLNNYFSDTDGDSLSFNFAGNLMVNINNLNGIINLNPEKDFFGSETIIFSASDGIINTLSNEVVLTVNNVNDAPVLINNIPDINFDEDTTYNLDLNNYFRDADGDSLSFDVSGNLRTNSDITNGLLTLTPQNDFFGNENLRFSASDGVINTLSNEVVLTVNNVNDAPVLINNIPDINFDEDTTYNLDLNNYFRDADGDSLNFGFTVGNFVSVLIDSNGLASLTGAQNFYGTDAVTFYAFDNFGTAQSNSVNLNILSKNDAPQIISIDILDKNNNEATAFYENETYLFRSIVSDIENDSLSYEWHLDNQLINTNNEFTYEFNFNSQGNKNLKLIVRDNSLSSIQEFNISVNNINHVPYFLMSEQFNMNEDEETTINLNAVDPDNDILSFSVTNGDNVNCVINNNLLQIRPLLNWFGTDNCLLTASDGISENNLNILINVNKVNDAPKISSYIPLNPDLRIKQNSELFFSIEANDTENDILSYKWYVNNELQSSDSNSFNYLFNNIGVIIAKVIVSDSLLDNSITWRVNIVENVDSTIFDGETTDLFNADLNNLDKLILEKSSFGKILFLEKISLGQNKNLSENVLISNKVIGVNTQNMPELNKKARITLLHQSYASEPAIFKSDFFTNDITQINQFCNECRIISFTSGPTNDGTVIFEVNGFSSYAVKENLNPATSNNNFCINGNKGNIRINLADLGNKEKVNLGENLDVVLEVNKESIVEYLLTDENKETVLDDSFSTDSGETEFNLDLEDLSSGDYKLLIKAYQENNEQNNCHEKSINIKIDGDKSNVKVKEFSIQPNVLRCNQMAIGEIQLENLGSHSEDASLRIYNKELNINFESNNIKLSKFGKDGSKTKIRFEFMIPDNLEDNFYDLNIILDYSDKTELKKEIKINKCQETEIKNYKSNGFFNLLQDEINVNKDGRFVIPVEISNNDNKANSFAVEINDNSAETNSKEVILDPLQTATIYVESRLNDKAYGKSSIVINLIENNLVAESRVINLNLNKQEDKTFLEYLMSLLRSL